MKRRIAVFGAAMNTSFLSIYVHGGIMKTFSVPLVAWLVAMLLIAPLADAAVKDGKSFAQYSAGTIKKREIACDCCMQCKAATKDIKSKNNGRSTGNGCGDCCERCGKKLPVDKEKIPEIIKKKN